MSLASVLSLLFSRNTTLRMTQSVSAAGMICALALSGGSAWANSAASAEVSKLLEQGKLSEAAQRAQNGLKQNASDVQLRFLQGVIATEQRKYDQAIQIFTALTQEFPAMPEPYNNLAVLYAAKGEDRKAAQVLEQAIRTNSSYATAHENLGDLYARMASDAYAKALQLDGSRKPEQPKLALIKQIAATGPATAAASTKTAAAAPAPVTVAAASAPAASAPASKPSTPSAAPAVAAPAPAPATPAAAPAAPTSKPAAAAKPAPAEPAKPTAKADDDKLVVATVEKAVMAWAKAWEQQNMTAYYAAYSNHFEPQEGSLAAWKVERKERIVGKPSITLEVRDLKVAVQGERATASFRQYYASGSFKATTRKTLRMQREGDKWRITREEAGR